MIRQPVLSDLSDNDIQTSDGNKKPQSHSPPGVLIKEGMGRGLEGIPKSLWDRLNAPVPSLHWHPGTHHFYNGEAS